MADLGEDFFEQAAAGGSQQPQPAAASPGQPAAPGAPTADPGATPVAGDAGGASPGSPGAAGGMGDALALPQGTDDAAIDPGTLGQAGAAVGLGAAKGVFSTMDFLRTGGGIWGDTPAEKDRSSLRQWVDGQSAANAAKPDGEAYSLTEGLAQGAVGLLGAGKVKLLGTAGSTALAALRTTAAYEPHAENLFNLADNVPGLKGPLTQFFASDQNDSAFKGYMKNALASLGVEGAVVGLVTGTAAMVKALRSGDSAAVEAASNDLNRSLQQHLKAGDEPSATSPAQEPTSSPSSSSSTEPLPGTTGAASGDGSESTPASPGQPGGLPAPEAGTVRLFHGAKAGSDPTDGGPRWVTTSQQYATDFRSAGTPNEVHYADIPADHPALKGARAWDEVDEAGNTNAVGTYNHFEAPEDIAKQLRPLEGEEPAPANDHSSNDNVEHFTPRSTASNRMATRVEQGQLKDMSDTDLAAEYRRLRGTENKNAPLDPRMAAVNGEMVDRKIVRFDAPGEDRAIGWRNVEAPSGGAPAAAPVDMDALQRMIDGAVSDQQALIKHGSWDAAIANGHTFGGEDHMPWQFTSGENTGTAETSLDAFTARVRDSFRASYDDAKGGAAVTDAANQAAVEGRVKLWNEDPGTLLGTLQAAGKRAGDLRADMQASFTVAQRLLQDSWTMASRIKMGLLDEWGGSQDAAYAALQQHMATTVEAHQAALSMSSNAGRALRGLRADQKLTPEAVRAVKSLGPQELGNISQLKGPDLVDLLNSTGGDPMALSAAARVKPTAGQLAVEGAQLYLVNNLISNPQTHAVIFASNAWQALSRPAERMMGSMVNGSSSTVGSAAAKTYYYMATAIPDALSMAYKAFKIGDSVIAPHDLSSAMGAGSGGGPTASGLGQAIAQAQFEPFTGIGSVIRNTFLAAAKTGTFPTRMVGFQDELVKQIVYRGNVSANAIVEGTAQGLKGDALAQFAKSKLYDSFDQYGRATDKFALNEAKVATYQNDLNPTGTGGYATQGYAMQQFLQNNPPARVIIPFMRTPVNLFRQGVQLTPGLNMLQQEYREAMSGVPKQGETAEQASFRQAQAIGQMGMGALIMGATGTLAYQGLVTGDAPSDPKLAAEAMADGWRPNSIVIPRANGGKTYIPFDRFDPVMMPFAMAANIVSVLKSPEMADQNKAQSMLEAMSLALIKQMTDKLYLQNLKSTLEAVQDPDKHLGKYAGGLASGYVPFSSALHLVNTDPIMREADTFMSAMLGKVPGYSKEFGARRDWAGDPVSVHKGLWLDTPASQANQEVERLALQQGASVGAPSSRTKGGADFRDVTLAGNNDPEAKGKNAYDRFQELAGHPERMPGGNPNMPSLRDSVSQLISSPQYAKMPDGDPATKGTKIATLMDLVNKYRSGAKAFMASDNNVRSAEYAETQRVATASGYATPNMPTPTNTADGVINRLGKMFGFAGAHAPSPAQPTLGTGAPAQ